MITSMPSSIEECIDKLDIRNNIPLRLRITSGQGLDTIRKKIKEQLDRKFFTTKSQKWPDFFENTEDNIKKWKELLPPPYIAVQHKNLRLIRYPKAPTAFTIERLSGYDAMNNECWQTVHYQSISPEEIASLLKE